MGAFRRKLRGKVFGFGSKRTPKEFFGFVFGTSPLLDWKELRRKKALRKYNENPNKAILDGYVDEAGNPLDNQETIYKYGKEVSNPDFRKPLVGHSWSRGVYGIAKREGDDEPMVFQLNLNGKTAKEFKGWKPFVPVRFLALVYGKDEYYRLYPSNLTKFQEDKDAEIDYEKWIKTASHVYQLDKLEQAWQATKDADDNWCFIEADLDYIFPEVDEDRRIRQLNITDDSVGLQTYRTRIPEDFPINFSEFSRIIVMGEVQRFKRKDESIGMAIRGYGVYPIPGKSIEIPEEKAFPAERSEEPIILWE